LQCPLPLILSTPQALKRFAAVVKHFGDISEDQFDFHTYCIRKMTLRAYVAMLALEDCLYSHKFFGRVRQAEQREGGAHGDG
jgi:hypothetical protein